jgi:DnaJ-domain-containing protein 1
MIATEIETIKQKLDQLVQQDTLLAAAYEAAYQNNLSEADKFALIAYFALRERDCYRQQLANATRFQILLQLAGDEV